MIQEIENRRSIRKYRIDKVDRKIIEEILYSTTITPSAKTGSPGSSSYIRGRKRQIGRPEDSFAGIVAVGYPDEVPDKRPRKRLRMLWNIEMEDKIFHINKIIY